MSLEFTFDETAHEYARLDGRPIPHITGMLQQTGWIDDRWYTEESSARGTAVHKLTADFDLGALIPSRCESRFKPYLLGHVACMGMLKPTILQVEEPRAHPTLNFAGRIDRVELIYAMLAIMELKSGQKEKSHQIQTALQAILAAAEHNLPPEAWARYCLYLKPNGKFKLEIHDNPADFREAYRIIKKCC